MSERKVTVGYSASVKCDLKDPAKGVKSYEGTTGHFTLTVVEDVADDVNILQFANERWEQLKAEVDKQVEAFYADNSKFAKPEEG